MFYLLLRSFAVEVKISKKSEKKLDWIKKNGEVARINSIVNRAIDEYYEEYREDFKALKKYEAEKIKQSL